MELQKEYRWINEEDFKLQNPLQVSVMEVFNDSKYGLLIVLEILQTREMIKMSLYGHNKNFLIMKYGQDTDKWYDMKLRIAYTQKIGTEKFTKRFGE